MRRLGYLLFIHARTRIGEQKGKRKRRVDEERKESLLPPPPYAHDNVSLMHSFLSL